MKILHTSDWHLGKRLDAFSRIDEQRAVMDEICALADAYAVDAVLVAGDLFDTINPPIEATELLYKTLKRLACNGQRAVIAIAGNHDSPDRIEAPDPLARECGIFFTGYPHSQTHPVKTDGGVQTLRTDHGFAEIKLPHCKAPLRIIATPYANEIRLRTYLGVENSDEALRNVLRLHWQVLADKYCDTQGVNILTTHLFMVKEGAERPEEPDDEKPILYVGGASPVFSSDVPVAMQYAALGHLHRLQTVDGQPCPLVYAGSPLAYSFSEADQEKFVVLVDAEPNRQATVTPIPLRQGMKLVRKRFTDVDDATAWLSANPDLYVELTMATDGYLTAEERQRLFGAHQHIVTLIPEVINAHASGPAHNPIDLSQSMEALFTDYFRHKHQGQEPGVELLNLFREVLGESGEDKENKKMIRHETDR
ncbi:MAG: exonuclease subunit SbcD [Breznakibacter sp.]